MGKDILAVLIGVFGTIIGFYFGSEIARDRRRRRRGDATAPGSQQLIQTTRENAHAQGHLDPSRPQLRRPEAL